MNIGLLSVSDRASAGDYEDRGLPALREWLSKALTSPWNACEAIVADDYAAVCAALKKMIDDDDCRLALTTGGTGPAARATSPPKPRWPLPIAKCPASARQCAAKICATRRLQSCRVKPRRCADGR